MRRRGAKVFCEKSKAKKHLFPTQEKAEKYMQNMILNVRELEGGLPQRVYYCESCGGWHMTSKAHILQQHIDDGSAVLSPKPFVVEQIPPNIVLHEDRLQNLRYFYNSWERKCKNVQRLIEQREILLARKAVERLVAYRVEKDLTRSEKEYFTDWRKRLVDKTLLLQRRLNNILECNTRKLRAIPVEPVIKFRYVPEPPHIPNPFETIVELNREISSMSSYLDDTSLYESIATGKGCYANACIGIRHTGRYIRRNRDEVMKAIACFSIEAEPLKSVVHKYELILERINTLKQITDKVSNEITWNRLDSLYNSIKKRVRIIKPEIMLLWDDEPYSWSFHKAM